MDRRYCDLVSESDEAGRIPFQFEGDYLKITATKIVNHSNTDWVVVDVHEKDGVFDIDYANSINADIRSLRARMDSEYVLADQAGEIDEELRFWRKCP